MPIESGLKATDGLVKDAPTLRRHGDGAHSNPDTKGSGDGG